MYYLESLCMTLQSDVVVRVVRHVKKEMNGYERGGGRIAHSGGIKKYVTKRGAQSVCNHDRIKSLISFFDPGRLNRF